jgi:Ca-activated chloride channel family protein
MTSTTLSLSARTDRRYIRSTYRSNRFVLVEVVAPPLVVDDVAERARPPVNLAFVLDRSGSMSGEKIQLARQAVKQSIERLHSDDRFSVVVYDDIIDVVVPSVRASATAKADAIARLATIEARNQTNLGGGWLTGCEQVALRLDASGVNRTLLLTDGLANVGITDRDSLAGHAAQLRMRGVATTTFGVGADFDEVLLQAMATAGGGNFYYIANAQQITDFITSEVGEALDVVARDVRLDITAPEGVSVESLSPFAFSQSGARTWVALGSLVAEQVVQLVLRLNFPLGQVGRESGAVLALSSEAGAGVSLSWEYADGKTNDMQERDAEVDRAVARVFAARARQEASNLNRVGNYPAAQAALASVAKRIRSYAGRDPQMRALIDELERDSAWVAAPAPAAALKEMHFKGYTAARMRQADGKAFRRSQNLP